MQAIGDPASAALSASGGQLQCQIMMNYVELAPVPSGHLGRSLISCGWQWLARFKGSSREHTERETPFSITIA